MLDPKGLESAIVAVEERGCVHFGGEIEAAIRAYLSTITPAEVGGLVERLLESAAELPAKSPAAANYREAASLIQSQAARIAELEAGLLMARKWMPAGHRNGLTATENMERDAVDAILNGERKG